MGKGCKSATGRSTATFKLTTYVVKISQGLAYLLECMDKLPHLYPAIAAVLKEARTTAGLSQQELADFSGLSRSYISFMECGERGVSVTALYQISKALKINGTELFRRIEQALDTEMQNGPQSPTKTPGRPRKSAKSENT